MLLRARLVLPLTAPPIEDGAVLVSGPRIQAVGRWEDLRTRESGPVEDLGDTALLPGFVNAHCHLDYTHLAGHLAPPRRFTDWIQGVLALKAGWSFSEYAESWIDGARQLLAHGCTTVMDIEAVPELLPEAWSGTPLRVLSALELTGVRSERPAEDIVREAVAIGLQAGEHPRSGIALSPHAPYSTRADLLQQAGREARRLGWRLTIHVAESTEEFDMFRHARGPLHDWLHGQRRQDDCGHRTPMAHVAAAGLLGPDCLVAHANCLEPGDVELLRDSGTHVVHCPRSHDYFGHPPFPYEELRRAGVNVCLGTDSLMSMRKRGRTLPVLDPRMELAAFLDRHPGTSPAEALELFTAAGARALGREGDLGTLAPGARADLIGIPYSGPAGSAAETLARPGTPVSLAMIDGRWARGFREGDREGRGEP